jgi:xanthine dehydrogenase YagR molybdenum-binding subunit
MNPLDTARNLAQGIAQAAVEKAIQIAPDSWVPGAWNDPIARQQHGHVGRPVSRIDGPLKVKGGARFSAEFKPDGMVYAALAFSAIARGRILSLDTTAASAAAGVVLVMTHENAPRMATAPLFMTAAKACAGEDVPVMQDAEIHWNGQAIALVLAETLEQAEHAASLITATYETDPAVLSLEQGQAAGTHLAIVFGQPAHVELGNPEAELERATFKVDATYTTPRHNHNAIEPHAVTLFWRDGELYMHDAVQAVSHVAWSVGQALGLNEDQVHVTSPYVGGGFGAKCLWSHQILAAAAARLVDRPVRMTLSREGVYRLVGGRAETEQHVALGADADGKLQALSQTGTVVMSRHNALPEPFILSAQSSYATKSMLLDIQVADLDMLANTFMRAPGEAVGSFALECAMDELAEKVGVDPVELRILNDTQYDPEKGPGTPFSSRKLVECLRTGADKFGWAKRNPKPGQMRDGKWLIGYGVASAFRGNLAMDSRARVTLRPDGTILVETDMTDIGTGSYTIIAQTAAEMMGVQLGQVEVKLADSNFPESSGSGGSWGGNSSTAGVYAACDTLRQQIAQKAGFNVSEVTFADGNVRSGGRSVPLAQVAGAQGMTVEGGIKFGKLAEKYAQASFGAHFCEVAVDPDTAEIRVRRMLTVAAAGRILNPKTARNQCLGGMTMGIGAALMEECVVDARFGYFVNHDLAEYHVPVHADIPDLEVIFVEELDDKSSPMKAKGVGELGICGVGAAVANAVYNATGVRIRDYPLTMDKLLPHMA